MNTILLITSFGTGSFTNYSSAAVVALFIFGYLIYSLVKPEKF
jgi:K+-transporting ATPase KdpF subunit